MVEHTGHRYTQTHCKRGHSLSGPDADVWVHRNGARQCKVCQRITGRERWAATAHLRPPKPRPPTRKRPALDRFAEKVALTDTSECFLWTGASHPFGHGQFQSGIRTKGLRRAHRWIWEETVGPIPDGLVIDHLCKNPACVNVDHLEPVTQAENVRRSGAGWNLRRRPTHCIRGHEFTDGNTILDCRGRRSCRTCKRRYRAPKAKVAARNKINGAIRSGRVVRPTRCEECGQACKPHAAHYNYDEPLRVRWLCATCHLAWDRSRSAAQ